MSLGEKQLLLCSVILKIVDWAYATFKCIGKMRNDNDHLPCLLFGPNFNSLRAVGITKIICPWEMSSASTGASTETGNLHDVPGVWLQHYAQTPIRQGRQADG